MYLLSSTEISLVSGGMVSLDTTMIQTIHKKAFNDGITFSALTVPLTMAFIFGLSNQATAAALTGVILAPYALVWGYCHSSIWNVIKN